MNVDNIRASLLALGEQHSSIVYQFTTAGPAMGLCIGRDQAVYSLIPIDDKSDKRFAEYLHSQAESLRKERNDT